MKTFLSLPTDNDFFNRYANLVPTLYKVGFLSQIVSGITECGIVYSVAFTSLNSLNYYVALLLSILACFVGVGFIELGLRKFIPYSVRVFIYKRFKGLDLAMTIFILITTIGLLGVSGHLSFKNSTVIIENYTPKVEKQDTQDATNEYNKERTEILNNYRPDSSSTANGYIQQIKAKKAEYQSLIDIENKGVEKYERQEQRTKKSFRTKKILIKTEIERLEAVRDEKISVLLVGQAKDLKALLNAKNEDLKEIKKKYRNATSNIEQSNQEKKDSKESKVQLYGLGLGWFTIICLCVLVLSIVLDEIHKKGSGIEEKVLLSQYDFSTGIVGDLFSVVNDKVQHKIRSKMLEWERKTPNAPLPVAPAELYDISELQQNIVSVKLQKNEPTKIVYLKDDRDSYENRREINNNDTSKKRECENCNNEYTYNHKKQKYCSDSCRVKAWEKRNGTKLAKRRAKN